MYIYIHNADCLLPIVRSDRDTEAADLSALPFSACEVGLQEWLLLLQSAVAALESFLLAETSMEQNNSPDSNNVHTYIYIYIYVYIL